MNKKAILISTIVILLLASSIPVAYTQESLETGFKLINSIDDYKLLGIDPSKVVDPYIYTPQVLTTGHLPFIVTMSEDSNMNKGQLDKFLTHDLVGAKSNAHIDINYMILINESFEYQEPIYKEVQHSEYDKVNDTWNNWTTKVVDYYKTIEDYRYVWKEIKNLEGHNFKNKESVAVDIVGSTTASTNHWEVDIVPIVEINDKAQRLDQWAWWNSNWKRYRVITIDHTQIDKTLTNFPVLVVINSTIGVDCDSGKSIRFIGIDNSTEYYYEIEKWDAAGDSFVWVNITTVSATTDTTFLMYYNNSGAADDQHATDVWDGYYEAVWHMNDSSGNVWDSTINHHTGTANGNPVYSQVGQIGYAIALDGNGDYFNVGDNCDVGDWDFTLEAWFNYTDRIADYTIMEKCDGSAPYESYYLWVDKAARASDFEAHISDGTDVNNVLLSDNLGLEDGNFHYIYFKLDGDTEYLNVDNWFDYNDNTVANVDTLNNTGGLLLGNARLGDPHYYKGTLDELRISIGIARNDSWMNASYNTTNQTIGFLTIGTANDYNTAPSQSGEVPVNGSTNIELTPRLYVVCRDDESMTNATWWSNSSGSWVVFASNASIANNTNISQPNSNFSVPSTTYYWSLNLTDGVLWCNDTYHFTTRVNNAPTFSVESPTNDSQGIGRSQATVSLTIEDANGDTFNWTIQGTYITNTGANGESNGSKSANTITPLPSNTIVYWYVNATDGYNWTNATYHFKIADYTPFIELWKPLNNSVDQWIGPDLYLNVTDPHGERVNFTWYSNSSGAWLPFSRVYNDLNGSFIKGFSNASAYDTWYWWNASVENVLGLGNSSEIYRFKTVANTVPTITGEVPANASVNILPTPTLNVTIIDDDGHDLDATWWSNSSGAWVKFGENLNVVMPGPEGEGISKTNSNFSATGTMYWWSVNVTDGYGGFCNETYNFTTAVIVWPGAPTINSVEEDGKIKITYTQGANSDYIYIRNDIGTTAPATRLEGYFFAYNSIQTGTLYESVSAGAVRSYSAWSYNTTWDTWSVLKSSTTTTTDANWVYNITHNPFRALLEPYVAIIGTSLFVAELFGMLGAVMFSKTKSGIGLGVYTIILGIGAGFLLDGPVRLIFMFISAVTIGIIIFKAMIERREN